jgi:hypothetical protein
MGEMDQVWEHRENLFSRFKCKYCVKELYGDGATRLSCVLCMTLMVFIYVYYGLFVCINLVDVMSLVLQFFSFHLPIFGKNRPVSVKIRLEIATPIYR